MTGPPETTSPIHQSPTWVQYGKRRCHPRRMAVLGGNRSSYSTYLYSRQSRHRSKKFQFTADRDLCRLSGYIPYWIIFFSYEHAHPRRLASYLNSYSAAKLVWMKALSLRGNVDWLIVAGRLPIEDENILGHLCDWASCVIEEHSMNDFSRGRLGPGCREKISNANQNTPCIKETYEDYPRLTRGARVRQRYASVILPNNA